MSLLFCHLELQVLICKSCVVTWRVLRPPDKTGTLLLYGESSSGILPSPEGSQKLTFPVDLQSRRGMGLGFSNQVHRRQSNACPDVWNLLSGKNSGRGWATERAPVSWASSQGGGLWGLWPATPGAAPAAITCNLMLWCGVLLGFRASRAWTSCKIRQGHAG